MSKNKSKFKEYKSFCRNSIQRPEFIPDDFRWVMSYHILRTYYSYAITEQLIEEKIAQIICIDINYLWDDIKIETTPEDYFLIQTWVSQVLEEWLEISVDLELYEVSNNLKNLFDFCE